MQNDKIIQSFVSLKKYNEKNLPTGMASGCLIRYYNRMFLLTVFHAVGDLSRWALELRYDSEVKRVKSFMLSGFVFLKEIDLNTLGIQDIDFAYVEIKEDIKPMYQEISSDGKITLEKPKIIHSTDFSINPIIDKEYCFAGLTQGSYDHRSGMDIPLLEQHLPIQKGLKYTGSIDSGNIYVFKLPFSHPGHIIYQGCSGSPLMDYEGNIVGLVIQGDIDKNEIYAINLNKYKLCLDIEVGLIK